MHAGLPNPWLPALNLSLQWFGPIPSLPVSEAIGCRRGAIGAAEAAMALQGWRVAILKRKKTWMAMTPNGTAQGVHVFSQDLPI